MRNLIATLALFAILVSCAGDVVASGESSSLAEQSIELAQPNAGEAGPEFKPVPPEDDSFFSDATYTPGFFELTGLPDPLPEKFTLRFTAPATYAAGDQLRAGSTVIAVAAVGSATAPVAGIFLAGQTVSFTVAGNTAFFGGGQVVIQSAGDSIPTAEKGAANGVATLTNQRIVTPAQIASPIGLKTT